MFATASAPDCIGRHGFERADEGDAATFAT